MPLGTSPKCLSDSWGHFCIIVMALLQPWWHLLQMLVEVSSLLGVLPIELQSPFGILFIENILESVFACQREGFLAVIYELSAEFSAEIWVRAEVGVVVEPVQVIFQDAVVCCLQEESDSLIDMPGKDLKFCWLLIDLDESSCQLKADVSSVLFLLFAALGNLFKERLDEIDGTTYSLAFSLSVMFLVHATNWYFFSIIT